jgi:hypothetical protein
MQTQTYLNQKIVEFRKLLSLDDQEKSDATLEAIRVAFQKYIRPGGYVILDDAAFNDWLRRNRERLSDYYFRKHGVRLPE